MREPVTEAAVAKGYVTIAMQTAGYTPGEIRRIMEAAYKCQYDDGSFTAEDAANSYAYYRPATETREIAKEQEAEFRRLLKGGTSCCQD